VDVLGGKAKYAYNQIIELFNNLNLQEYEVGGVITLDNAPFLESIKLSQKEALELIDIIEQVVGVRLVLTGNEEDGYGFDTKAIKTDSWNTPFSSSGGGGGGGSKWENPYDKLYTTLQKINSELRLRERLEREY
jgi:hypothetical protein